MLGHQRASQGCRIRQTGFEDHDSTGPESPGWSELGRGTYRLRRPGRPIIGTTAGYQHCTQNSGQHEAETPWGG